MTAKHLLARFLFQNDKGCGNPSSILGLDMRFFTGRVDIHTHPYTTAACAAGVVTKTTDRDSLRYTYNGTRRVSQLALGCESN